MKKISVLLISILLIFQTCTVITASAETDATFSVISAYYNDGKIDSFLFAENQNDLEFKKFSIIKNDIIMDFDSIPSKLINFDSAVNYMLLIDTSTSMVHYGNEINNFAKSLIQNEKKNVNISIAVFGEKFKVVKENLSDVNSVSLAIEELEYNQNATEISGGLIDALDYMSNRSIEDGELSEIILLTDGTPYLSDSGNDQSTLSSGAQELKNKIEDTPEVVVHSVSFNEWEPITYSAVSLGTGLHANVSTESAASDAGKEVSQFTDSIYRLKLPYSDGEYATRVDVELIKIENSEIVPIYNIRNYDKIDSEPASGNIASASEEETSQSDLSSNNTDESTSESASEEAEAITSIADNTSNADATKDELIKNDDNNNILPIVVIGIAVLLIAAIVAFIILKSKKSGKKDLKDSKNLIYMKAEIISGNCETENLDFQLKEELIIGSDNSCDLVFDDYNIAPKNSRIYISDGIIYIEDLNLQSNTYLNDMKIHSSNRLRSGDKISIGNVSFQMRF